MADKEVKNEESTQTAALTDDTIKEYLRNAPLFFERNAAFLADIHLPSPHGKGTISLTERQQLAQRDKIRTTESIMEEMVAFGKQNETTNQQLHALSLAAIANNTLDTLPSMIDMYIKDTFALNHASLHCWGLNQNNITATPEAFMHWMVQQLAPYCGPSNAAISALVEAGILADTLQSFALIPLYTPNAEQTNQTAPSMGVLVLGADNTAHFNTDMGTLFLQRIGEIISTSVFKEINNLVNDVS